MPVTAELWPLVASTLVGGGVFALGAALAGSPADEAVVQAWRYDVSRATELRRVSLLYRLAEPVIGPLARMNRRWFAGALPEITRELQAAGRPRFWSPEEWLAVTEVQAVLLSVPLWILLFREMGPPGLLLGFVGTGVIVLLLRRALTQAARYRLWRIKLALPYLLDLLTLLMEAGSTFLHALEEGVREFREEPVGQEFGRVLAEMQMGKSRTAALDAMRDRLSDDEIGSLIGAIIQGEQLGTPLALLFRAQADVLRLKRTQRAETIAGEAAVKMLFPAVLIMVATVIIMLGPFVLGLLTDDWFAG
ncbi:MAG TPA: type II secretion system F family protein [Caulifigura sp.]|nr:type II secretion system F family protein [Caulifigura sp.]